MKQVNLYNFDELPEEAQKEAIEIFFKNNFSRLTEEAARKMLVDTGELFFENGHYSLRDF